MEIRAVLVDDELNNLENLEQLLETHCPGVTVLGKAIRVLDGINMIEQYQPNLVFLDIQMSNESGFDLLQKVNHHNFEVIFVTAYEKYAIQAMKFSAIDYLLKPIDINELKEAVQRAKRKCVESDRNRNLENLLQYLMESQGREEHRIALSTQKETRFVKPKEIIRCQSSNNYTSFVMEDGTRLLVSRPIFEFEEILAGYGFVRCHQSHLVNVHFVKSWKKEDGDSLLLINGDDIPIARNRRDIVKTALVRP